MENITFSFLKDLLVTQAYCHCSSTPQTAQKAHPLPHAGTPDSSICSSVAGANSIIHRCPYSLVLHEVNTLMVIMLCDWFSGG